MPTRPHRERLLFELNSTRKELLEELKSLSEDKLDWAPAEGMKSFRAQLVEIGAMEAICASFLLTGKAGDWPGEQSKLEAKKTLPELLAGLQQIRSATLGWLKDATEEQIEHAYDLPEDWHEYFESPFVEAEELLRWIVRHEYYHLGQMIIYLWQLGFNPYKKS